MMKADLMEAANREALSVAAALGRELGYTLKSFVEESGGKAGAGARMTFARNGFAPRVVVEVYPERCARPRSLLMYVEVVPSGALPNRFRRDARIDALLIKGGNRCWNVLPGKMRTRFNLRRCRLVQHVDEAVRKA